MWSELHTIEPSRPSECQRPIVLAALSARDRGFIALVSLLALLPGTFGVSLIDRDEGWYAQVSRELLRSGDFVVPTYLGAPWLAKPPLLYWCVAGCFQAFGESAGVARLANVVASVLTAQLLAQIAARLSGRRAALLAATSFSTALLPVLVGRMLLTDALLCLWSTLAAERMLACALRGVTLARAAAFWAAVGLAILTKGPAIVPFVAAFAVGLAIARPDAKSAPSPQRAVAILAFCSVIAIAIALPWFILAAHRAPAALWQQFFGFEIASRLVGAPHGHSGPPGYHALVLLAGWFPWTLLAPGALIEAFLNRRIERGASLLLCWLILPWALLECVPSKLPHYALPCFVPFAILMGQMWDRNVGRTPDALQRRVVRAWVLSGALCGLGICCVAFWAAPRALAAAIFMAGALLIVGFALVWRSVRAGHSIRVFAIAASTMLGFHAVFGLLVLPALEPMRLSRRVAEQANALQSTDAPVRVCGFDEPSLFFYLRAPGRVVPEAEIVSILSTPAESGDCTMIVRDDIWARLSAGASKACASVKITGFNYVKGEHEGVWVVRREP